jgi:hypothetical protein
MLHDDLLCSGQGTARLASGIYAFVDAFARTIVTGTSFYRQNPLFIDEIRHNIVKYSDISIAYIEEIPAKSSESAFGTAYAEHPASTRQRADSGSRTMSDVSMSDTKRVLVALVGGLLMSFACLTAALAPANAAAPASAAKPILL